MICPIWPWVTVVKQKKYMPILTRGYLSSNKGTYNQFWHVTIAHNTSTRILQHCSIHVS